MKKSAFTLIELLVVIVIIGILATISVAQFNKYQERARLAKAQAAASQINRLLLTQTAAAEKIPFVLFDFNGTNGVITNKVDNSVSNFTATTKLKLTDGTPTTGTVLQTNQDRVFISNFAISEAINDFSFSTWLKIPYFIPGYRGITHKDNLFVLATNGDKGLRFVISGQQIDYSELEADRWHHVLASVKDDQASLWIDGELVQSVVLSNPSHTGIGSYFYFGNPANGALFEDFGLYPVGIDQF